MGRGGVYFSNHTSPLFPGSWQSFCFNFLTALQAAAVAVQPESCPLFRLLEDKEESLTWRLTSRANIPSHSSSSSVAKLWEVGKAPSASDLVGSVEPHPGQTPLTDGLDQTPTTIIDSRVATHATTEDGVTRRLSCHSSDRVNTTIRDSDLTCAAPTSSHIQGTQSS